MAESSDLSFEEGGRVCTKAGAEAFAEPTSPVYCVVGVDSWGIIVEIERRVRMLLSEAAARAGRISLDCCRQRWLDQPNFRS
jgi:hypothetical protein